MPKKREYIIFEQLIKVLGEAVKTNKNLQNAIKKNNDGFKWTKVIAIFTVIMAIGTVAGQVYVYLQYKDSIDTSPKLAVTFRFLNGKNLALFVNNEGEDAAVNLVAFYRFWINDEKGTLTGAPPLDFLKLDNSPTKFIFPVDLWPLIKDSCTHKMPVPLEEGDFCKGTIDLEIAVVCDNCKEDNIRYYPEEINEVRFDCFKNFDSGVQCYLY